MFVYGSKWNSDLINTSQSMGKVGIGEYSERSVSKAGLD